MENKFNCAALTTAEAFASIVFCGATEALYYVATGDISREEYDALTVLAAEPFVRALADALRFCDEKALRHLKKKHGTDPKFKQAYKLLKSS